MRNKSIKRQILTILKTKILWETHDGKALSQGVSQQDLKILVEVKRDGNLHSLYLLSQEELIRNNKKFLTLWTSKIWYTI